MENCANTVDFNIQATAGLYSTLAGVLAGFAFTALVLILTVRLVPGGAKPEAFAQVAQVLLTSFIGLVLSSLTYAVLAGATATGGRSASEEVIAGLGFAVCALLLLYAIVLSLEAVEHAAGAQARDSLSAVIRFFHGVTLWFVAPLLAFYLYIGTVDYLVAHYGRSRGITWLDVLGVGFVVAVIGLAIALRQRAHRPARVPATAVLVQIVSITGLALVAVSAVGFALFEALLGPCDTVAPVIIGAVLSAHAVGLGVVMWCLHQTTRASFVPRHDEMAEAP